MKLMAINNQRNNNAPNNSILKPKYSQQCNVSKEVMLSMIGY
jgi:hypothetical protein